ncbi:succinate dehydrogenase cytochrome b subunit [Virgisporangium ochraceum]|nr:succinate dehydrogenase cytochrome b subunit [Virgisporangium ochraceum]
MAIATAPLRSSVGLKIIMAVTGGLLVLFLVAHMVGNLKVFVGESSFDHYAHWLRTIGAPVLPASAFLWIQRVGLLVAVGAHLWSATVLTVRARRARPVRYAHRRPVQGSYSARTMRWGGVIIGLFVVYHVLDLTVGTLNPVADPSRPYANVVADFAPERWPVTLLYTLAVVALGFHLAHGIDSAVRTLGGRRGAHGFAVAVSALVCAGFLSVPFAVLTGVVS